MTFVAIKLFLANTFGWLVANWRMVAILAAIVLIAIASILLTRSCGKSPALNEAEIQKGEQAIQDKNDKVLREVLVASEVREAVRETSVVNAEANTVNAIHESRNKWANANISEMQAEFDRRKNQ